jgi:8-oxo-dGTP diphosphatase
MLDNKVGAGVGVIIVRDGKLLLGQRVRGLGAGSWSLPGGHVEFGETFEESAKRETLEETGVIVRSASVICVNSDRFESAHYVTVGLVAQSSVGEPKTLEPDSIKGWAWFPMDALPAPIFMPSRNVLDCYLANRVNKC